MAKKSQIFIGTSGYSYEHWKGLFYPEDLPQDKWFEYFKKYFNTVELNVTFYRLPQKAAFKSWYERTPKDFLFVCKGSRFITHVKKLNRVREAVKLFFKRSNLLKEKLGVILWQLPPNFKLKVQSAIRQLADKTKNSKVKEEILIRFKKFLELLKQYPVRQAFEFRDKSWFCKEIFNLLKRYKYALVIADSPRYPLIEKVTSDFVYLRFHGGKILYGSEYSKKELKTWAEKIKKWQKKKLDVYGYFNNDAQAFAIKNAKEMKRLVAK
jgi:uncharacterized protein YecE (DUF72 family)